MKIKILFICILCTFLYRLDFAQSVSGVPVDIQLILIPKILSYDKNFTCTSKVGVGIVFNSSLRSSAQIKDDIIKIAAEKKLTVRGNDIIFIPVDISQKQNISDIIKNNNLKAIYITPLRSFNLNTLVETCKGEKVISFTDVPEFVDYGICVYFDLQNNKPRININLKSVEADGVTFAPELLKIANVVK